MHPQDQYIGIWLGKGAIATNVITHAVDHIQWACGEPGGAVKWIGPVQRCLELAVLSHSFGGLFLRNSNLQGGHVLGNSARWHDGYSEQQVVWVQETQARLAVLMEFQCNAAANCTPNPPLQKH